MHTDDTAPNPVFSGISLLLGAIALTIVVIHFVNGPLVPQPETGTTLGELASDIGKSMLRDAVGMEQPAPVAKPWDLDNYISAGVIGAAVLSLVLAAIALARRENKRLTVAAGMIGGFAITFQFFATTVLMIIGALILISIIYALRDVIGSIIPF